MFAGQRVTAEPVRREVGVRRGGRRDRRAVRQVRGVDFAGVAGHEVDRARRRGPERRAVGVVAHREVLRVVPQRRDGVAVVVVHDLRRVARRPERARAGAGADRLHEVVHLAFVEGLLLVGVVVVLVAGELAAGRALKAGRAAVEPLRRCRVGVAEAQVFLVAQRRRQRFRRGGLEAVDRRCALRRLERLAIAVRRLGVGAEVVVEGDVLSEDHDNVLDRRARRALRRVRVDARRARPRRVRTACKRRRGDECAARDRERRDERSRPASVSHRCSPSLVIACPARLPPGPGRALSRRLP
jgi:hypothetical protein